MYVMHVFIWNKINFWATVETEMEAETRRYFHIHEVLLSSYILLLTLLSGAPESPENASHNPTVGY